MKNKEERKEEARFEPTKKTTSKTNKYFCTVTLNVNDHSSPIKGYKLVQEK